MNTALAKDKNVTMGEMLALQEQLIAVKREHGIEEKEGRISRAISRFFDKRESREECLVSRKKYLLLAVLTGWMGGHRFYAKRYRVAMLYLLFFWTGLPLAMTITDILIAIPKETDEHGRMRI